MIKSPIIGSDLINSFNTGEGIGFAVLEIFILIALIFYIIFAFVIVRQVNQMTDTLEVGFESPLRFTALLHFVLSIGVFLLALVIL